MKTQAQQNAERVIGSIIALPVIVIAVIVFTIAHFSWKLLYGNQQMVKK